MDNLEANWSKLYLSLHAAPRKKKRTVGESTSRGLSEGVSVFITEKNVVLLYHITAPRVAGVASRHSQLEHVLAPQQLSLFCACTHGHAGVDDRPRNARGLGFRTGESIAVVWVMGPPHELRSCLVPAVVLVETAFSTFRSNHWSRHALLHEYSH